MGFPDILGSFNLEAITDTARIGYDLYKVLGWEDSVELGKIILPGAIHGAGQDGAGSGAFMDAVKSLDGATRKEMFDALAKIPQSELTALLEEPSAATLVKCPETTAMMATHPNAIKGLIQIKAEMDAASAAAEGETAEAGAAPKELSDSQVQTVLELSSFLKGLDETKRANLGNFMAGDKFGKMVERADNALDNVAAVPGSGVAASALSSTVDTASNTIDTFTDGTSAEKAKSLAGIGGGIVAGLLTMKIVSSIADKIPGLSNIPMASTIIGMVGFMIGFSGLGKILNNFMGKDASNQVADNSAADQQDALDAAATADSSAGKPEQTDAALLEKGALADVQTAAAKGEPPKVTQAPIPFLPKSDPTAGLSMLPSHG